MGWEVRGGRGAARVRRSGRWKWGKDVGTRSGLGVG